MDGFRFDLAPSLARESDAVERSACFFDVIRQDPVMSQVKLIAEPRDVGQGGYQLGNFPVGWAEWNGRYRDAICRYWRGDPGQVADLAHRLTGSSDLYQDDGRRPYASVNFVTAHDGFTLADLVSYNGKHNEANGEENRDGSDDNLSWNSGVEGPTDDSAVLALRERRIRTFLATLLNIRRRAYAMQRGRDGLVASRPRSGSAPFHMQAIIIQLRKVHAELQRRKFFQGRPLCSVNMKDLTWHRPDGGEMAEAEWRQATLRAFGFRLCGEAMNDVDERGEPTPTTPCSWLLNAEPGSVNFMLAPAHPGVGWEVVVDMAGAGMPEPPPRLDEGTHVAAVGRSLKVLRAWKLQAGTQGERMSMVNSAVLAHAVARL